MTRLLVLTYDTYGRTVGSKTIHKENIKCGLSSNGRSC